MSLPDPTKEPTVSVPRAAALLGIGRDNAYAMVASGSFPVPVLALGERPLLRIPTAPLLDLLGLNGSQDMRNGPAGPLPVVSRSATELLDSQSGASNERG